MEKKSDWKIDLMGNQCIGKGQKKEKYRVRMNHKRKPRSWTLDRDHTFDRQMNRNYLRSDQLDMSDKLTRL